MICHADTATNRESQRPFPSLRNKLDDQEKPTD